MRRGRAGRCRKRRWRRQAGQGVGQRDDRCAELRKWMVAQSSKADLANTLHLVPFYFPDTGRGLKTRRPMGPGSVIMSVPYPLLVTPGTVFRGPLAPLLQRWKVTFTPHQLLTLFLLTERDKGADSRWQPFISSLPSDYTLPHYFSTEELNLLPLHASSAAQRMLQRCRHAHRQIVRFCAAHRQDGERLASWEKFRWAWCSVSSRAVFLETEAGTEQWVELSVREENNVALCPYLDLLNHSATATVGAGLNGRTHRYEIVTEDSYQPHDQVFISYGPHDNTTLFLNYGFTLPRNPHNTVAFSLDDFTQLCERFHVVCWDQKQGVLRKHQLHRALSCSAEGVSWNLMCALNILAMNWDQLQRSERAVMGEELPPAVVASARRMALHLLRQTLAERQARLAKLPQSGELTPHLAIAHRLLTDDINILTLSLQDVR